MLANYCMFACALFGASLILALAVWIIVESCKAYWRRHPDALYISATLLCVRRNQLEHARHCLATAEARADAHADAIEREGQKGGAR